MKTFIEKIRKGMRLAALALSVLFAREATADWLWWTVDFTDDWGNEGELESNPAGEGATGWSVWLTAVDENGGWSYISEKFEVTGDKIGTITQTDLAQLDDTSYTFFVQMGKTSSSGYSDYNYRSKTFTYEDLASSGYVTDTIEGMNLPWNPAVSGSWSAPEPSGGLLTLVGLAMLLLRRRRDCV